MKKKIPSHQARLFRPNVIFIVTSQHKWDCLGYAGNPDIRTPNFDALASHGLSFSQAICQSTDSAASRATLLTGLYPQTHGVNEKNTRIASDFYLLPELLKEDGYLTARVGQLGFELSQDGFSFDIEGREHNETIAESRKLPKKYIKNFGLVESPQPERSHPTTLIGDQAVRFIQRSTEPFFLWAGFTRPCPPYDPPSQWQFKYKAHSLAIPGGLRLPATEDDINSEKLFDFSQMTEDKFRQVLAAYYGSISHIDKHVGRILATLHARGITNNIFVFCSDKGDYMGQHGLVSSNAKPYDSLLRVPLLIAGIVGQRRSKKDAALVELADVVPTILDRLGVPAPEASEGKSLMRLLMRESHAHRSYAYSESSSEKVIRGKRYKIVDSTDPDLKGVYDLQRDPNEHENLHGTPKGDRIYERHQKALRSPARHNP